MLNLVLGKTGTGKTTYVREKICEFVKDGKQVIFIVPEQFSFETERTLLDLLGPALAIKAEVLSFTRLAEEVFREFGGKNGKAITDTGRAVLMSLALENLSDDLKLYGKYAKKTDMIEMLVKTVNEFKMCGIQCESLLEVSKKLEDSSFKNKINDLSLIMQAYEGLVYEKFIDDKDLLSQLVEILKTSDYFENKIVFMDGFKGFTKHEFDIISYIINDSKDFYVTFCTDSVNDFEEGLGLFSCVKNTVNRVISIAKKNNIEISTDNILNKKYRFVNEELEYVENGLFSVEPKVFSEKTENISICCATTLTTECDYIAARIKKLLRVDNYRCKEIAVIARNIDDYRSSLKTSFNKYEIPYFEDLRQSIDTQPIMMFCRYMFEYLTTNTTNAIFHYLRTGVSGVDLNDIDILENYVFVWNIKGKDWDKEWTNHPKGYGIEFTIEDEEILLSINNIRKRVIEPLLKLRDNLLDKSGFEMTKILFDFLIAIGVPENLKKLAMDVEKNGDMVLAHEQNRVWEILVNVFEQMSLALEGEIRIDIKKYGELLNLAISLQDIGNIPQGIDEISIGSADRIRTANPRAVFIIGANDGVFPQTPTSTGVLSDFERHELKQMGIELSGNLDETLAEEKFISYTVMCSSKEKLFISYPKSDLLGKELLESTLVTQVVEIVPNCEYIHTESLDENFWIESDLTAFEWLASNYNSKSEFSEFLRKRFEGDKIYESRLNALERALKYRTETINNKINANMLFSNNMYISPSRVESYYKCAFSYFCKYGLDIQKNREAKLDILQTGTIIHYVLENLISEFGSQTVSMMEYDNIEKMVEQIVVDYLNQYMGGNEGKTPRFSYLLSRLVKIISQFLVVMKEEFEQSQFVPTDFELVIDNDGDVKPYKIELPDGTIVNIRGKVDRVDIMKSGGKSYIRIVDYKSSKRKLKLSDVLEGVNLQMLLYLQTILSTGEKRYNTMLPAGILYMSVNSPQPSLGRNASEEEIEREKKKAIRMEGLVVGDPLVIRGMEEKADGVFIPAKINDEGKCSGDVISRSQMDVLFRRINELVSDMAVNLKDGKIQALPLKSSSVDACKWCDYNEICGYNDKCKTRRIEERKNKEVLDELEGETSCE